MITVTDLTKRYARHTAVDHISFEVHKGQIVGFLGPNGAGKTTTMRMLTCFLPPTSGTATVAGFDADVKDKLLGKLSRGYRQRVGLAQAIIHNPDVLILDEPTSGLDPKQINETRELIKSLAGDHTIILSTHILPEVEQTCEQVIIINKGKLVATDSVSNLQNRARGAESLLVEVGARNGLMDPAKVQSRLELVSGVTRVVLKNKRDSRSVFEVESRKGLVRGDLARAVVEAGWDLNELRPAAVSLEEVFLQLTGDVATAPAEEAVAAGVK
jgi:ABC-2 type transport system ATP-binding protein